MNSDFPKYLTWSSILLHALLVIPLTAIAYFVIGNLGFVPDAVPFGAFRFGICALIAAVGFPVGLRFMLTEKAQNFGVVILVGTFLTPLIFVGDRISKIVDRFGEHAIWLSLVPFLGMFVGMAVGFYSSTRNRPSTEEWRAAKVKRGEDPTPKNKIEFSNDLLKTTTVVMGALQILWTCFCMGYCAYKGMKLENMLIVGGVILALGITATLCSVATVRILQWDSQSWLKGLAIPILSFAPMFLVYFPTSNIYFKAGTSVEAPGIFMFTLVPLLVQIVFSILMHVRKKDPDTVVSMVPE